MIGWRIKVNLVAFLVISAGLLYAMATQVLTVLQPRYSVYAVFPDAGGVFTNQEVTYRGITVGQVGEMTLVDDGVKIELKIKKDYDEIPRTGVEARVMFKSAVGEQFVDLLPGSDEPPYLSDGDVIPKEQNSIPVSTQQLLGTLEAVLRGVPPEALEGAVDALGAGLTGRGPDIATIIGSMAELAELFADRAPEVQGLLKGGSKVGKAFVDSSEDFSKGVRALVEVSEELSEDRSDINRLLENTNATSDEVVRLLEDYKANIDRFLPDLAALNDLQADHAADLADIFRFLPAGLNSVANAFEPSTGMIRFGLVQDSENHGCSYGTPRRRPSNREPKRPSKNARCGSTANDGAGSRAGAGAEKDGRDPDFVRSVLDDIAGQRPALPARMADWSWSLLYLNSV